MEREEFSRRLTQLRMEKGVSARDMSLSIGQSPNYINGIESGSSFPSMTAFFYICDYLGVTPREFFDTDSANPAKIAELVELSKTLSQKQLEHLIGLLREFKR